ncbi:MAG: acyl-CoA dehydrogenase family protein [Xanthobacteraceae bacterium]
MLKACACETLQEVVHGYLQLHGGTGFVIGTPIERMAPRCAHSYDRWRCDRSDA